MRGLIAAAVGLLIAVVGMQPQSGVFRFVFFDEPYLLDGLPITIVALAMFGIPAALDLALTRVGVEQEAVPLKGRLLDGVKDTFREWWLASPGHVGGSVLRGVGLLHEASQVSAPSAHPRHDPWESRGEVSLHLDGCLRLCLAQPPRGHLFDGPGLWDAFLHRMEPEGDEGSPGRWLVRQFKVDYAV